MTEYDARRDGFESYNVAIAAKRAELLKERCPSARRVEVIGACELYLGDCMEIIPHLGKVDAVVTDPPYGIADKWKGGSGSGWGKAKSQTAARNEWDASPPPAAMVWAWRRQDVPTIVWGGNYFDLGGSRGWLVWNKPERNFTLAEAELAWTNIDMRVRVFDHPRSDYGRVHPTQKPVEMMNWCLQFIPKANVILDPYMGSGTTGVACAKAGKGFVGIEIDEGHFNTACERIRKAYAQPDMFVSQPAPKPVQEELI